MDKHGLCRSVPNTDWNAHPAGFCFNIADHLPDQISQAETWSFCRDLQEVQEVPASGSAFRRDWRRSCKTPEQQWAYLLLCCSGADGPQVVLLAI